MSTAVHQHPRRKWPRFGCGTLLLMAAVLTVPLVPVASRVWRLRGAYQVVADVRDLGAHVTAAPSAGPLLPPRVVGVDLADLEVEADLVRRLEQLPFLKRMNLRGAIFDPEVSAAIAGLGTLHSLNLNDTSITDTDLASIATLPVLQSLTLSGTTVTDDGLLQLLGSVSLQNIDVSETHVTAAGVASLSQLTSLKTLTFDADLITDDLVKQLRAFRSLDTARLRVTTGLAKEAWQRTQGGGQLRFEAYSSDDEVMLWSADVPWSDNVVGVLEIVATEVDLDSDQVNQLVRTLAPAWRILGRSDFSPLKLRDLVIESEVARLASVDEFLAIVRDADAVSVSAQLFARDTFNADHVPALLGAINDLETYQQAPQLQSLGAALLVRHGLDDPAAIAELDRMLADEDEVVRARAAYAFGWEGVRGIRVQNTDWRCDARAAEIGLPRLVRLCEDRAGVVRHAAAESLYYIAQDHPRYVGDVFNALVTGMDYPLPSINTYANRLARLDPAAARSIIPVVQALLDGKVVPEPWAELYEPEHCWTKLETVYSQLLDEICFVAPELVDARIDAMFAAMRRGEETYQPRVTKYVSVANHAATKKVVRGLLDMTRADDSRLRKQASEGLVYVAIAIRNQRVPRSPER